MKSVKTNYRSMTILVGGSAHIPKIQKLLQDFLSGKNLNRTTNSDEIIAYGTDVQATILVGEKSDHAQIVITYFNDQPGALIQVYEVECAVTKTNSYLSKEDTEQIVQEVEKYEAEGKRRDKLFPQELLQTLAFTMKTNMEVEEHQGKTNNDDRQAILN
ncbi:hypothetical protein HPG69_000705 [Diceros bicornis minor]|uniref:Uncharacterized protein n=1 Tax=Diceros bicornis minor TaxID=77932 RepID=A0A7J7FID2_DICBM|nr:hypothetical protein HPG69_000705 [Diceros bicornis minor]